MNTYKTYSVKKEDTQRKWHVIDATDFVLGRLATTVSHTLRGKGKPEFTPNVDNGDFVIIVNAEKIQVTGKKMDKKFYYRHSGYPGGIKGMSLRKMKEQKPEEVIYKAVKGMMPRNRLGRAMLKKLKVYAGPEHPHQAQQPAPLER